MSVRVQEKTSRKDASEKNEDGERQDESHQSPLFFLSSFPLHFREMISRYRSADRTICMTRFFITQP